MVLLVGLSSGCMAGPGRSSILYIDDCVYEGKLAQTTEEIRWKKSTSRSRHKDLNKQNTNQGPVPKVWKSN